MIYIASTTVEVARTRGTSAWPSISCTASRWDWFTKASCFACGMTAKLPPQFYLGSTFVRLRQLCRFGAFGAILACCAVLLPILAPMRVPSGISRSAESTPDDSDSKRGSAGHRADAESAPTAGTTSQTGANGVIAAAAIDQPSTATSRPTATAKHGNNEFGSSAATAARPQPATGQLTASGKKAARPPSRTRELRESPQGQRARWSRKLDAESGQSFLKLIGANWIWSPAYKKDEVPVGDCYFRKTF